MRRTSTILWALLGGLLLFHFSAAGSDPEVTQFQPVRTYENQGPADTGGRMVVVARHRVTPAMLDELRQYGKVHGVIDRYQAIAVTPRGPEERGIIESLAWVDWTEDDQPRYLTAVGTWDRDILDVVDVEEDGFPGDPDPREVDATGAGVHVAIVDTGLIHDWRTVLDERQVRTDLARAFMGGGATALEFNVSNPTNLWEKDTNGHGTAVAAHVIGFFLAGQAVDGVAPDARIIPLKVFPNGQAFTFSSRISAAIAYVTDLRERGVIGPTVINLSLGGAVPSLLEQRAIQDAIAHGLVVVAAAGNQGEAGMSWPGAFPEVISVGAIGWTRQFENGSSFWWAQDVGFDPDPRNGQEESEAFVTLFSGRAIPDLGRAYGVDPQELDVLAPGLWTVAPCRIPGVGEGNLAFCFWAGTSFSAPLTAGVAALLLEKAPDLTQTDVQNILKTTTRPMNPNDARSVPIPVGTVDPTEWDTTCGTFSCDPVGAGLLQADAALAALDSKKPSKSRR